MRQIKKTRVYGPIGRQQDEKKEFARDDLRQMLAPTLRTDQDIQDIKWAQEHDNWPMRPSGLCGYCPVTFCPQWREPRK